MTCRLNISVKESCADLMRGKGGPDPLAKFKFLKLHYNIAKNMPRTPPPPPCKLNNLRNTTPLPGANFSGSAHGNKQNKPWLITQLKSGRSSFIGILSMYEDEGRSIFTPTLLLIMLQSSNSKEFYK